MADEEKRTQAEDSSSEAPMGAEAAASAPANQLTLAQRLDPRHWGKTLLDYVSGSVTPMLPGIISAGMIKVFLLLATVAVPAWEQTPTYTLLAILADAGFYFLPIWVAWGAAQKLGATPLYAMLVAAAIFAPDFIALVEATPQVSQDLFGLPVMLTSYGSSLLPALLLSYAAFRIERLLDRIIPGVIKPVFVGSLTVLLTYTLTMVALAPIGTWLGNGIVGVIMAVHGVLGPIAPAILTGVMPFLIMFGVHMAFVPFMIQLLETPGYDAIFRPAFILHNMAEGGACLGVALRTKNAEFKAEAISCAVSAIFAGVTEPALYGVTFRLRKPLIGTCVGGAAGGLVAGLLGARGYVMGFSSIFGLPVFQETIGAAAIGVAVTILVSAAVAFVLGFDEDVVARDMAAANKDVEQLPASEPVPQRE